MEMKESMGSKFMSQNVESWEVLDVGDGWLLS